MSDVHVHGVVRADEPTEIASAPVRRVEHRELAALVSDVEGDRLVASRLVRMHWKVLEEAGKSATVLPVRFGTVMAGDGAVVDDFLAPRHDDLVAAIAELAGKVQLTVKGFFDEQALMRGVLESSPAVARLRERVRGVPEAASYYQRIELGQLVAAEVERVREADTTLVLDRLAPLAAATSREPPATIDAAVSAAFLVERDRVDEFSRAVSKLGEELAGRIELRYVGPLPPYSFAGDDAQAGSEAWA